MLCPADGTSSSFTYTTQWKMLLTHLQGGLPSLLRWSHQNDHDMREESKARQLSRWFRRTTGSWRSTGWNNIVGSRLQSKNISWCVQQQGIFGPYLDRTNSLSVQCLGWKQLRLLTIVLTRVSIFNMNIQSGNPELSFGETVCSSVYYILKIELFKNQDFGGDQVTNLWTLTHCWCFIYQSASCFYARDNLYGPPTSHTSTWWIRLHTEDTWLSSIETLSIPHPNTAEGLERVTHREKKFMLTPLFLYVRCIVEKTSVSSSLCMQVYPLASTS